MRIDYGFTDRVLTSHAGLPALADVLQAAGLPAVFGPSVKRIPDAAIATTEVALLGLGKTDFEAVNAYRGDPSFTRLLGLKRLPSAEILRQRLDTAPRGFDAKLATASFRLLEAHARPEANGHGYVPLDIDSSPMDNAGTQREGVSWTYKHFEGYHPLFAYLGEQGYMVASELRPGSQHTQNGFLPFFRAAVARAKGLSHGPLLCRMDAGHDAADTLGACLDEQVDFICRWNPRGEDAFGYWLNLGPDKPHFASGPGYHTAVSDERHTLSDGRSVRRIVLVTRRDADGEQLRLTPDFELEGYWTSLEGPVEAVVDLYQAHGTCEQFHSELKSDIGLERFPSGKFKTNAHVLACAQLAFNALRVLGERMQTQQPASVRPQRVRRQVRVRLRTVMQTLLYHAGLLARHARGLSLKLGRHTANAPWVLNVLRACSA